MASLVGKLLFAAALFLFLIAFVFVIIGYDTYWLIPRLDFTDEESQVNGVGLKSVCFTKFKFEYQQDKDREERNGCYRNTRNSAAFTSIDVYAWSPPWFQTVQDMHLSSIVIMTLNILLFAGFLTMYFYAAYLKRHGKTISPCLILTEYGLALWFILTFVLGIILFVEIIIFYHNYQSSSDTFYYSVYHQYKYGPGFGLTTTAAVALIISGCLGAGLFCGMVKVLVKTKLNAQPQSYYSPNGSHYSESEVDGLSLNEERQSRKDPDGIDAAQEMEDYKKPPMRSDRKSTTSLSRDMMDDKGERPVPAPRRSVSSKDVSREPSVARTQDPPSYTDVQQHSNQYPGSQAPSVRSSRPSQFQYDLKPGYGYVPKPIRSASDVDSQYSSANQRSTLSPHSAPVAGGKLYVPPSRSSYAGSTAGQSDMDSHAERNRSVSRSAASPSPEGPTPTTSPQKVIKPKDSKNAKHSRYAAAGW